MSTLSMPTLAGLTSTVIFAVSTLPMLAKAYHSRDLSSYSFGNIVLANVRLSFFCDSDGYLGCVGT